MKRVFDSLTNPVRLWVGLVAIKQLFNFIVDSDEKVDILAPNGAGGRNSRESSNLSIDTKWPCNRGILLSF